MDHIARTAKDMGHALRYARKQQQLSQKSLAVQSGVWQETISRIENGSSGIRLETLFDLCAALNLEIQITDRSQGSTDFLEETL